MPFYYFYHQSCKSKYLCYLLNTYERNKSIFLNFYTREFRCIVFKKLVRLIANFNSDLLLLDNL